MDLTRIHIQPETFAADVSNAVCDYCADGMDAFESCLAQAPALEPQVLEQIRQGSSLLYRDLLSRVEGGLTLFEQLCRSSVFKVPLRALLLPTDALQAALPTTSAVSESEEEVDEKLRRLREEVNKVGSESRHLLDDIKRMDDEVASYGELTGYEALSAAASTNKENVIGDVAAIAAAAAQLRPLLDRAAQLRAQREPLAARQQLAGGLTPGAPQTEGGLPPALIKARQLAAASGSLEQLQLLGAMLRGPA